MSSSETDQEEWGFERWPTKLDLVELEARLDKRLDRILGAVNKMEITMATDYSKLEAVAQQINDSQTKLAADQAKNAVDITAAITALGTITVNPADQAKVDAVVQTLTGVATAQQASASAIEASNAQLEAALAPAGPSGPTGGTG